MKIFSDNGILKIETSAYQGKNGAIYLNFGNSQLQLSRDYAEKICYDIPDFDLESYKKYYYA